MLLRAMLIHRHWDERVNDEVQLLFVNAFRQTIIKNELRFRQIFSLK
jgi:hypothetical protein